MQPVEHSVRPGALADVEQEGPGRVGGVCAERARELEVDVVLGEHDVAHPGERAGSCSIIHSILGAVKPGSARFPASSARVSLPTSRVMRSHWAEARWSHQIMQGATASRPASRRTEPCIWPETPTPRMSEARAPLLPTALLMAAAEAPHQSAGSCSAHPGRGVDVPYSSKADERTRPDESITPARAPVVPRSSPSMRGSPFASAIPPPDEPIGRGNYGNIMAGQARSTVRFRR